MDMVTIHEQLTGVFRSVFKDEALVIEDSTTADDVAEWDSLNHINLIISVEKAFNLKFSNREVASLERVGDLKTLIRNKLS